MELSVDTPIDGSSDYDILDENVFIKMLSLERKRTERCNVGFVLMLADFTSIKNRIGRKSLENVLHTLLRSIRETDIKGWYNTGSVFGVIFTGVPDAEGRTITNALSTRVTDTLSTVLTAAEINDLNLSFLLYPEESGNGGPDGLRDLRLYPDLQVAADGKTIPRIIKRSIDVLGSIAALVLLSPLLLAIALAVKLTSNGPVLFRQQRIGQYGRRFTFLKFRTMQVNNDATIHEQYVKKLIAGAADVQVAANGNGNGNGKQPAYKLTNDPRVTPVGRILRRTSLDELPQLLNVLKGEMSLVGPRPPIPYEFDAYRTWHKRRVMAVKPGITGPWQVGGRSRVKFDEMVRLDLQYARSWSVWQDLKILWKTPKAVFSRDGAW